MASDMQPSVRLVPDTTAEYIELVQAGGAAPDGSLVEVAYPGPQGAKGDAGPVQTVNHTAPDAQGDVTIDTGVMTVNGTAPDATGNITVASGGSNADEPYLRVAYTCPGSGINYQSMPVPTYTVAAGDKLVYDLYWENAGAHVTLDLTFTNSSTGTPSASMYLRDSGVVDQNGFGNHPKVDLPSAVGAWLHREFPLDGWTGLQLYGAPFGVDIANEYSTTGTANPPSYAARIKNARIVNSHNETIFTFIGHELPTLTMRTATDIALTSAAMTGVNYTNTPGGALPDVDAARIKTGTVPFARLPTGTTSTTVAIGNHSHGSGSTFATDVEVTDATKGVILKDPITGDRYRVRVVDGFARPELIHNYTIGSSFMGGYVAGIIDTRNSGSRRSDDRSVSGKRYVLIVAPKSLENAGLQYRTSATNITTASVLTMWDGLTATNALASDSTYAAAAYCAGLSYPVDGGSKWYLPSVEEMDLIHQNLYYGNGDVFNVVQCGTFPAGNNGFAEHKNLASMPQRLGGSSNYPAATPVAAFQSGGSEMVNGSYWTSTSADTTNSTNAYYYGYGYGVYYKSTLTASYQVRPVRRFEF